MRIFASRPYAPKPGGATSLADLSTASLLKVMRAEGFAGEITLRGNVCTWAREIDWHGPKETPDVGRLDFAAEDTMLETGMAADYTEQWQRTDNVPEGALRMAGAGRIAYLVTVGNRFVFGVGPVSATGSATALAALEAGQRDEAALAAHFESVYIFGRWHHGVGIAIQATNPLLEGEKVLHCSGRGVTLEHMTYHGQRHRLIFKPVAEKMRAATAVA